MFTAEAIKKINAHDVSKPMFLYLAHQAVHSANKNDPLQAPADLIEVTEKKQKNRKESKRERNEEILPFFNLGPLDPEVKSRMKLIQDACNEHSLKGKCHGVFDLFS